MKTLFFRHEEVKADGTFENKKGAVGTEGGIIMSMTGGGCDIVGCHCSDGHWITIIKPRTEEGTVEGLTVNFEDKAEMEVFFRGLDLIEFSHWVNK